MNSTTAKKIILPIILGVFKSLLLNIIQRCCCTVIGERCPTLSGNPWGPWGSKEDNESYGCC